MLGNGQLDFVQCTRHFRAFRHFRYHLARLSSHTPRLHRPFTYIEFENHEFVAFELLLQYGVVKPVSTSSLHIFDLHRTLIFFRWRNRVPHIHLQIPWGITCEHTL